MGYFFVAPEGGEPSGAAAVTRQLPFKADDRGDQAEYGGGICELVVSFAAAVIFFRLLNLYSPFCCHDTISVFGCKAK